MSWNERDRPGRVDPPGHFNRPNDYGQADYDTDFGYDAERRSGYRATDAAADPGDFGQADYSQAYGYDPVARRGYRNEPLAEPPSEARSWRDRLPGIGQGRRNADRALWGAVTGRLAYDRRIDASDIHVIVEDGVVVLEGVVRHRAERERAEDLAEVRGARYVRNNLRIRERRGWF